MKKSIVVLSICAALTSLPLADAVAAPAKKRKVKVAAAAAVPELPQVAIDAPGKDETTIEETKPEDKYPWTKYLSGTVAGVSNYMFRGVSQSRNLPAVQAGLTFTTPMNFYLSGWGSNVSFPGTAATVEMDLIMGYRNTYGDNLAYDINVGRYNYPAAPYLNYNEFNGIATFYFLQAALGYSANVYATHKTGIYYSGGINYNIPPKWVLGVCDLNLTALMGHYSLPRAAGNSYNDYSIQLSKAFNIYRASIQWTNTDGRQHIQPYNSAQLLGQLAATF